MTIDYIIEIYTDEDMLAATIGASGPVPSEDELITWPTTASPSLTEAVVAYVNHRINSFGRSVPHVAVMLKTELAGRELLQALGFATPGTN